MRIILIFLTLLLTAAWLYTSWYWYTCNIKGFCDRNINATDLAVEQAKKKLISWNDINQAPPVDGSTNETVSDELPRVIIEETPEPEENIPVEKPSQSIDPDSIDSLCESPLVGPIEFGKNNDVQEVERLEKFLISRWENLEIDGNYGQKDFEAVKRFQTEYKEEILDPWGVTAPTGFVFRTTVKKINEIACK